jgi:penicillin amidase
VPVLRDIFGIAVPASGGIDTINRAAYYGGGPAPYAAVHGPGMRAVYDLAAPERSRFVVATGQSGNVLSKHYDDMNPLWREGRTIEIGQDAATLRRDTEGVLVLTPADPAPGR